MKNMNEPTRDVAPSLSARRGRRAGAALDGIVAALGAGGRQAAASRRTSRRCASPASTSRTASSRLTGGRRAAAPRWNSARPRSRWRRIREDLVFLRGLYQPAGAVLHQPAPGPHPNLLSGATVSLDPNEIRVGTTLRSGARAADRQPDRRAQPGAGHRAERAAAGRRPVDDLRLVASRGPRRPSRPPRRSIRRGPSTSWSATARAASSTAAFSTRCSKTRTRCSRRSARGDRKKLDEYLESIRDIEKRIDRASKEERLEGWRPTLEAAEHAAPGGRAAAERARST